MTETLLRTPLYNEHLSLGAKIVPFAGWEMPVSYSGIIDEHITVRNACGLFDVSHMGEFFLTGKDVIPFLNILTVGNFSGLSAGRAKYSIVCHGNGGVVDDIIVYRLSEEDYLLCVNAGNIKKDWEHFNTVARDFDVQLENRSNETALVALQGPRSPELIALLFPQDESLSVMRPFRVRKAVFNDVEVTVASTGYTGEKGYEIFLPEAVAVSFWQEALKGGRCGVKPIGLGARDTLRLEKKYPLYGNDLDDETSPVEAGLHRFIDDTKPHYSGKERIHRELTEGVKKTWVCLSLEGKRVPRHGYKVFSKAGDEIGVVTSGSFSPSLNRPIVTAYIPPAYASEGTPVGVDLRGRILEASVTESI